MLAEALRQLGLPEDAASNERVDTDRLARALTDNCKLCMHAALFGHWGPLLAEIKALTHCRYCHRSWSSVKEAHCRVCCTQFASNEAASFHWVDDNHVDPLTARRDKKAGGGPRYIEQDTPFGKVLNLARYAEYRERRGNG